MRSETEAEGEIDASRGALRMRIQEKDSGVILGTPDPLPAEQGDAGDGAPDIDRRARFRRIAPSSAKRSAGWIHNLNIIATAPTAENSAVEESDFKVQLDGPARFFSVYYGVRPGTTRIFTFRNIPAGKYEMQVAYGNEMINDNFSIEEPGDDEFIEIEIEF
jgi:hypothetical protein